MCVCVCGRFAANGLHKCYAGYKRKCILSNVKFYFICLILNKRKLNKIILNLMKLSISFVSDTCRYTAHSFHLQELHS